MKFMCPNAYGKYSIPYTYSEVNVSECLGQILAVNFMCPKVSANILYRILTVKFMCLNT